MAMNMPSPSQTANTPAGRSATMETRNSLTPRSINVLAGLWLAVSAFLWPHSLESQTNSWVVGGLVALVAIFAKYLPRIRFVNVVLGGWLFASTFAMPHVEATMWHNAAVAVIIIVVSMRRGRHESFAAGKRPLTA
jgi:hypothetical protein